MYKPLVCFLVLFILVLAGCNTISTVELTPTEVSTPTPEPLTLIDGKINACLLITPLEIEAVVEDKVTAEIIYPTGYTGCKYTSVTNKQVVLLVDVATDTTVKEDKFLSSIEVYTAVESYELIKTGNLNFAERMSGRFKVEDVYNIGDHAYITYMNEGTFITIYVLKHNIFYQFVTRVIDDGGVGYDALIKLTKQQHSGCQFRIFLKSYLVLVKVSSSRTCIIPKHT